MIIKSILPLVVLISLNLSANQIEDTINKYSYHYNIDKKIINTIISTESNFDRYAIGISTSIHQDKIEKYLKQNNLNYKKMKLKNSNKYFFSTLKNSEDKAVNLLKFLQKNNIKNYGLGLMQISSYNLKTFAQKYNTLTKPDTNIKKGVSILRWCFDKQKITINKPYNAIECYYKGGNIYNYKNYEYLTKFAQNFK